MGGCGPVMRAGPHLGGGPDFISPAPPLPVGPRGCTSATASARGGHLRSRSRPGRVSGPNPARTPPAPDPTRPGPQLARTEPGPDRVTRGHSRPRAPCRPPRRPPARAGPPGPGISVGGLVLCVVTSWWRSRPAGPSTTKQGDERFRLRWLIQEKRAEGGGRDLVKMRPQNTSANSNSTVKVPARTALALAA